MVVVVDLVVGTAATELDELLLLLLVVCIGTVQLNSSKQKY